MADASSKTERVVENTWFKLVARGAMTLAGLLLVPAVVALFQLSAAVDRLAAANTQLKTELVARVDQTEARINLRLAPLESRQNTQSDWMRQTEVRVDQLTDRITKITVQVAVLVERNTALVDRINALIDLNKPQPAQPPRAR